MQRMKTWSALLAISLVATACRSTLPASLPSVSVAPDKTDDDMGDGVARVEYHGIPGLFFTWDAVRQMFVRVEQDKAALSIALSRATVDATIATDEAERLRKSQKALDWRATWGPPLAFAGGLTLAGALAAVLFYVFGAVQAH